MAVILSYEKLSRVLMTVILLVPLLKRENERKLKKRKKKKNDYKYKLKMFCISCSIDFCQRKSEGENMYNNCKIYLVAHYERIIVYIDINV